MITQRKLSLVQTHGDEPRREDISEEMIFDMPGDGKIDIEIRKTYTFGSSQTLACFVIDKEDAKLIVSYLQTLLK